MSERLALCQERLALCQERPALSERLALCPRCWHFVRETGNVSERPTLCQGDHHCVRETGIVSERPALYHWDCHYVKKDRRYVRETGIMSETISTNLTILSRLLSCWPLSLAFLYLPLNSSCPQPLFLTPYLLFSYILKRSISMFQFPKYNFDDAGWRPRKPRFSLKVNSLKFGS